MLLIPPNAMEILLSIIKVLLDSIIYQTLPAFKGYGFWGRMEGVKKMS